MVARAAQKDKGWPEKWNDSEQCKNVTKKIQELRDERKDVSVPAEIDTTSSYAASWATQFNLVTRRTFTATWRDTNYLTGKFMIHVSIGLFIGFSFFKVCTPLQGLPADLAHEETELTISARQCRRRHSRTPLCTLPFPYLSTPSHSTASAQVPRLARSLGGS